ncbi:hypothetical protein ABKV19_026678 [Rosa sericea]
MSMILMVNEKFRENVAAWVCFHDRKDAFKGFLGRVLRLKSLQELALANIGSIDNQNDLSKRLSVLSPEELKDLVWFVQRRKSYQLWENYSHVALDVGNVAQAVEAARKVGSY